MSDKKDIADAAPKKKGKMKTILIGGVALIAKKRDTKKGVLMLIMAAVLLANVAIWTL